VKVECLNTKLKGKCIDLIEALSFFILIPSLRRSSASSWNERKDSIVRDIKVV